MLPVTQVDQSETVEVRIMQFPPVWGDKFHSEILTGFPEWGVKQEWSGKG